MNAFGWFGLIAYIYAIGSWADGVHDRAWFALGCGFLLVLIGISNTLVDRKSGRTQASAPRDTTPSA